MCGLALGAAAVCLLTACGAGTAEGTPEPEPVPDVPVAVEPHPDVARDPHAPPTPEHVRVTGIVFSAEGDVTIPSRPLDHGQIVVLSMERFRLFQLQDKHELMVAEYMRQSFDVPKHLLARTDVETTPIKEDGTYALWLVPGEYALCLADLGGVVPEDENPGGAHVDAWFEARVSDQRLQTFVVVYDRISGEIALLD